MLRCESVGLEWGAHTSRPKTAPPDRRGPPGPHAACALLSAALYLALLSSCSGWQVGWYGVAMDGAGEPRMAAALVWATEGGSTEYGIALDGPDGACAGLAGTGAHLVLGRGDVAHVVLRDSEEAVRRCTGFGWEPVPAAFGPEAAEWEAWSRLADATLLEGSGGEAIAVAHGTTGDVPFLLDGPDGAVPIPLTGAARFAAIEPDRLRGHRALALQDDGTCLPVALACTENGCLATAEGVASACPEGGIAAPTPEGVWVSARRMPVEYHYSAEVLRPGQAPFLLSDDVGAVEVAARSTEGFVVVAEDLSADGRVRVDLWVFEPTGQPRRIRISREYSANAVVWVLGDTHESEEAHVVLRDYATLVHHVVRLETGRIVRTETEFAPDWTPGET